jgi:hypothetical protein
MISTRSATPSRAHRRRGGRWLPRRRRLRDLDAIDADVAEQQPGELELSVCIGDVGGLLVIAQRRVHDLDAMRVRRR